MNLKKTLTFFVASASVITPLIGAIACGNSGLDLTKNIVVLSPEMKDVEGNVTKPLDNLWDQTWAKFKAEFPDEAKKYNLVKKNLGYDQYEKLDTIGITSEAIPDIWFFPTDKMYLLQNENKAIAELPNEVLELVKTNAQMDEADNLLLETQNNKNYGIRFKNETMLVWMNAQRLDQAFPGAGGAKKMGTTLFVNEAPQSVVNKTYTNSDLPGSVGHENESVQQWFERIQNDLTFDQQKTKVAQIFTDYLDVKKVANEMVKAKNSPEGSPQKKELQNLLPVPGENGWPANAFVYAENVTSDSTIGTAQKGLIWKEDGKLRSVYGSIKNEYSTIFKTWYDLATTPDANHINAAQDFQKGLNVFSIEGTWSQKSFTDEFTKNDKLDPQEDLFAFPLPMVDSHQLRHYQQGWNFGLNIRNATGSDKFKAASHLMANLFEPDIQKLFNDSVEQFVPGNISDDGLDAITADSDQYIEAGLNIINDDPNRFTVLRSDIPDVYFQEDWDTIYSKILEPLKKDNSGVVSIDSFSQWANSVTEYLTTKNIYGINN